ncbi:MAG: hypothetical protein FWK04_19120 [Nostoc sp. GBBB01]|uniref:Phytanoyl-CoA dioxygenase (PhyH) n=1 Tax=Nostoc punctiforme FACHB-252 TaxID=1357509 RepID=A0ABR8HCJ2_NOSPU|nr:hypothetical protein [Nostoc punctiforme]MBD2613163.1 hypothetical protein [Nostoc punctiforme FACHB-252]MBL1201129.1 hypothetical protein [Nostoc sp. GBBB01]
MLQNIKKKFPFLYNICYENYIGLTKNPRWLLMRKVGRFRLGRLVKDFLPDEKKYFSQTLVNKNSTLFPDIDIDFVVNQLTENGFCLGLNLPKKIVDEITDFAEYHPCHGDYKPHLGFFYNQKKSAEKHYDRKFKIAGYFNTSLLCTAIKKLQNDPTLLAIAAKYLECNPVHLSNQLWWSFAGETTTFEKMKTFQMFHYDLDDYRFLKFFFYLTDVDAYGGPHVCVRGSHNQKKLSHLLLPKYQTDEAIISYYQQESLVTIYGKAGFGFAEDTFCFHKGTTPITQDRLMLQVEFGTVDYNMQHDIRDPFILQIMKNSQ